MRFAASNYQYQYYAVPEALFPDANTHPVFIDTDDYTPVRLKQLKPNVTVTRDGGTIDYRVYRTFNPMKTSKTKIIDVREEEK